MNPTTRRTVVTAAWSVPAVVAVGAAPAFAASVPATPKVVTTSVLNRAPLSGTRQTVYVGVDNRDAEPSGEVVVDITMTPTVGSIVPGQSPRAAGVDGIWIFVSTTPGANGAFTFRYRRPDGVPGSFNGGVSLNTEVEMVLAGGRTAGTIAVSGTVADGVLISSNGTWGV